jgi:AraC-like DNA-binding protein
MDRGVGMRYSDRAEQPQSAGRKRIMDIVYPPTLLQDLEILSCRDGQAFASHLHDGYVLWLNSESGEHYQVSGSSDILQPGSVSLIEPEVVHCNRPYDPARRHLRSFYFSTRFVRRVCRRLFDETHQVSLLGTTTFRDPRLWGDLARLHQMMLGRGDPMRIEEAALMAFADVFRGCTCTSPRGFRGADDRRVRTAVEYMHAHPDQSVSLAVLARIVRCTEYHLIRLFKRYKGLSPHAFHLQLRLERARRLIEQGLPLGDVAQCSGLSDQSHLTRVFKRRYGLTPGQYRSQRLK